MGRRRHVGNGLDGTSLFRADNGPQVFLRAAANTNEKRNYETCFINVRGSHG